MTLCNSCGQDNKKNVKFCSKCGTKIEDNEIEPKSKHYMDLGKPHPEWIPKKQPQRPPKTEFPASFSYRGVNRYKSEGTTLALSLFVGLLGVMGVGHRYVGNVIRSLCILGIGYGVTFLWFSHLLTLIVASQSSYGIQSHQVLHPLVAPFLYPGFGAFHDYYLLFILFTIAVPVGYYIFLTWQIFDARKQCRKFNLHMDEVGAQFWEVTKQWKILYCTGILSPILAGVVLWFIVFASNMLSNLFYDLFA